MSKHAKLEKKAIDDVLGGEEEWKNVAKTDGESVLAACGSPALVRVSCKAGTCISRASHTAELLGSGGAAGVLAWHVAAVSPHPNGLV